MSEPEAEPGTAEPVAPLNWEAALTQTSEKLSTAASEPDPSNESSPEPAKVESEVGDAPESKDALEPPERWTEDNRAYFKSLDRKSQEFLLSREKDVEKHLTEGTQKLSETQKRYERIDGVLKPYEEIAKTTGIDLAPVVGQALQYYSAFQRDPVGTIKFLIQAQKLTPEALGLIEDATDPAIRELRERNAQTERELANLRQGTVQQTEAQNQALINTFKDAKSEDGSPKYPHFESVRSLMAPLVASGKSLEDAYSQVVWTVPEVREAHAKAEREKAAKEEKAKAERTRLDKLKKAKSAETLAPSDAERGTGRTDFKKIGGWHGALSENLSKLRS